MDKVYCDANVFIDYFHERSDYIRPLKDLAFNFFSKGWNCAFKLVVSDWLLTELRKHLKEEQIEDILSEYRKKGKLIEITEEKGDRDKAGSMSEHWQDALHAILANKAGADFLATRNVRDYEGYEKLVKIVFPEFI